MTPELSRRAVAALSPEMRRLFVNQSIRGSNPQAVIDWATDQLVAGKDSPALRILAGLNKDDSREVRDYFRKALAELKIPFPNERLCLFYYVGDLARGVLSNTIPPLHAFAELWQILVDLNHPYELRSWLDLEIDLDVLEDQGASALEREKAVRKTCEHFITLLDSHTETGLLRLTWERSLSALRSRGLDAPSPTVDIPRRMPAHDDEESGLSFFRTRVDREDFRDLTVPWTLFLRSEIANCNFENADLSESSMTWCDWNHCYFRKANLRGCDLRSSIFRGCSFYDAILDEADLRGAWFENCHFGYAHMNGTKVEKWLGLSAAVRRRQLRLSREQGKQINWTSSAGKEPDGG